MNIHPALVHFPIALLLFYAVLELLSRTTRLRTHAWVEPVKAFLVILGTVSAMVTLSTGEAAEHIVTSTNRALRPLVEVHSFFASTATGIFGVLGGVYLIHLIRARQWYPNVPTILQRLLGLYLWIVDRGWLMTLGALLGLIAMTITGALGGAIVYGPTADPIIKAVYGLFF